MITTENGNVHHIQDARLDGEWTVVLTRRGDLPTEWTAQLDFVGGKHPRSIILAQALSKDTPRAVRDIVAQALVDMAGLTPKGHNIDIPVILERRRLEAEGDADKRYSRTKAPQKEQSDE